MFSIRRKVVVGLIVLAIGSSLAYGNIVYTESFSAKTGGLSGLGYTAIAAWTLDTARGVLKSTSPGGWDGLSHCASPAFQLNRKNGSVTLNWTVRFPTSNTGPSWRENNKTWLILLDQNRNPAYRLLYKPNRKQDMYTSYDFQLLKFVNGVETEIANATSHRLTPSGANCSSVGLQFTLDRDGSLVVAYDAKDGQGSKTTLACVDTTFSIFTGIAFEFKTGTGTSNYFTEIDNVMVNQVGSPIASKSVYEYQYITLDARQVALPNGSPAHFVWRQIKGSFVNIIAPASPLCRVLSRTADTLGFELASSDPSGIYPIRRDTVRVVVFKAGTAADFLNVISTSKTVANNNSNFAITTPGLDPTYSVASDSVPLSGTSSLDLRGATIYWTVESGASSKSGTYLLTGSEWKDLHLPVSIGDNRVTLVCTTDWNNIAVDRVIFTRSNVAIENFTVSPDGLFADSTQNLVFSVLISGQAAAPAVQLLRVGGVSYPMLDNGIAPDLTAGDHIFTTQVTLKPQKDSTYQYRIRVIPSNADTAYSAVYTFSAQPKYDPAAMQAVMTTNSSATTQYFGLKAQYGAEYALDSVSRWLLKQPNVRMAGVGPGGMSLCWEFTNGVHAMIGDAPEGTKGGSGKYKVKGLSPFKWNFTPHDEFDLNNSYDVLKRSLLFDLDSALVNPNSADSNVSIEDWKNWGGYDVIIASSHGQTFGYDSISQIRSEATYDDAKNGQSKWSAPFVCVATATTADSMVQKKYWSDLTTTGAYPRMVINYSSLGVLFCLTPKFFSYYDKSMNGTLIYMSSCRSMYPTTATGSLWNAFKANGVRAMLGYTDYVQSSFASAMGTTIFSRLVQGDTLKYAFDSCVTEANRNWHVENGMPADNGSPARAHFVFAGDSNFVFDTLPTLTGCWNVTQSNNNYGTFQLTQNGTTVTGMADWVTHPHGPIDGLLSGDSLRFTVYYAGGLEGFYSAHVSSDRTQLVNGETHSNKGSRATWFANKFDCSTPVQTKSVAPTILKTNMFMSDTLSQY